jgi:myo-inositol 2-dehydrogenase / D-chiro-inositol 1-dehydrogenase
VSSSEISVALVGLGDIGVRAHLPALLAESRVSLAVIADVDPGRVEHAAALAPGVRATTDVDAVVADRSVDAVVLATPAWVTARLARAALRAGRYVLAEKPIAPTLDEARELAEEPGVRERYQIGLTYRHHPAVERLRKLIETGALGRPLLVQASTCDERADPHGDPVGFARRLRSLEYGPPMISDGVHACDRLNYLLGQSPVEVVGVATRSDDQFATANANLGLLRYEDGSVVRLEVVWLYPVLPPSQFVITGPFGRAVLDPPTFALTVELADGSVEELSAPGDKTEVCFRRQLASFVDHCLAGTAPVPGVDEGLASLALAQRVAAAAGLVPEPVA